MPFFLSPTVKVIETDLSTSIGAVATSIGVIVLRDTYKGPENKQFFVTNTNDLISSFGKPTSAANCYKDIISASAFLQYGNKLYCTRVLPGNATFSGTRISPSGTGSALASAYKLTDLASEDPDYFGTDVTISTEHDAYVIASSRGTWGNNIRVAVCNSTDFAQIRRGSYPSSWTGSNSALSDSAYWDFAGLDTVIESDSTNFLVAVQAKDQNSNTWENKEFFNVSTSTTAVDDQGVSKYVETVINHGGSQYIKFNLKETLKGQNWTASSQRWIQLSSGTMGTSATPDGTIIAGYQLYANPEEIDVNIIIDSDKSTAVKQAIITMCESRMDCMAVLDCPYSTVVNNKGNEATSLRNWRMGLGTYTSDNLNVNTSYASLYGNWLEVYDQYNNTYRWVPSSGYVAGIYAHTDDVTDPWWAPAGLNRAIINSARKLAWNPTLGARDLMYKVGINPIVSFAGQGKVVWGQKTLLDKESAFNRVNVRRLFMVLEKAIATASKYFLFEPNDNITRMLMVGMIEPFLRDVKARRGVYDFKVVCDETNNSPERIDRNELWCSVYIKPVRAAEYIILNFICTKTGASFDELAKTGAF